jgi:hypothetical protein
MTSMGAGRGDKTAFPRVLDNAATKGGGDLQYLPPPPYNKRMSTKTDGDL